MAEHEFSSYSDEALLAVCFEQNDAMRALLERFLPMVQQTARRLSLPAADFDDACQEGLLAVVDAARRYSPEKGSSFAAYAGVSVKNRLLSMLRNRQKLSNPDIVDGVSPDIVPSTTQTEDTVMNRARIEAVRSAMDSKLTEKERKVLLYLAEGYRYDEMAAMLGVDVKSVNNAIFRMRKKLRNL